MTGTLTYAAAQEHGEDLRRNAGRRRRRDRGERPRRRRPLLPRLRPRHAYAA